jgi:caa(3)-type oxidase subunit IV
MSHNHDRDYVKVWGVLLVLLAVSIVGPLAGIRVVTLITAFGVAIVKAYIVATRFMHLNIEKRWVAYILVVMLAFMLVMFGGVAPDVLKQSGHNWDKTYEEPALLEHGEGSH